MKQIGVHEFCQSATKENLKEWVPCEITRDGHVIATLLAYDVDVDALGLIANGPQNHLFMSS